MPSTSHRRAVHPHRVGLVVGVELVGQVPDQRTEQILDRDDALDSAVLVDNHRESPPLPAHLRQHLEHESRLRHQERLAEPPRDVDRARGPALVVLGTHLPSGPEQIVDEEDADQVVEVLPVDREAAVARLADRLGHRVHGQRDGERDHVDPWGHHLAHRGVPDVVQGIDDELLLGVCPTVAGQAGRIVAGTVTALTAPPLGRLVGMATEHGHDGDPVSSACAGQAPATSGADTMDRGR